MDLRADGPDRQEEQGVPPLAEEFMRWLDDASDVELCRAVMEEEDAYRVQAMVGIKAEIARRALDPEVALRKIPEKVRTRGDRRRYLYGGLVLAGLALVPALLPRVRSIDVMVHFDNASSQGVRVNIGRENLIVVAGNTRQLPLRLEVSEPAVLSVLRAVFGRAQTVPHDVPYELVRLDGSFLRTGTVTVVPGGRTLIPLATSTPYVVETRRYRKRGRLAYPEGDVARTPVTLVRTPVDLDRFPLPSGTVRIDLVDAPFPQVLEREGAEGRDIVVRRIVRAGG